MPSISTPSKIAGTQAYTSNVLFSGSTSQEREAKVAEVVRDTGAVLIPPYDHPDIVLGQGTTALEMDEQFQETREADEAGGSTDQKKNFDLVICPLGGGGILSGIATYFSDRPSTRVFGAEPSYQGCDDGKRGLEANPPSRITSVKSLTIADGLRTPVGEIPWQVFTQGSSSSKPNFLEGIRSVSEQEIKDAMRLLMERMKLFVEPSAAVGLAALLYDEEFRQWIVHEQLRGSQDGQQQVWDVGVVLTGGNTTIEAIAGMFSGEAENKPREAAGATTTSREQGKVGLDGKRVAENIAG
jgi:threonine dehydratase